jgi:Putative DNA-binding domain
VLATSGIIRQIFTTAQNLVRSAERLGREQAPTYEHIIRELIDFLRRHSREIEAFVTFAHYLSSKNELAPAILFSYAVWGSTKRGDRSLDGYTEENESQRFRLAGELALGISGRWGAILLKYYMDLLGEAYEDSSEGDYVSISESRLLHIAQIHIRENALSYFTGLRDSVRHIDTLCQEYLQRENLYADDRFAKRLLRKISGRESEVENRLWDVKETLEMWSVTSAQKEAAAIKFCERVASFANREGGILLIGVTNMTHEIVGVPDPENKIKEIESALRRYTDAQGDVVHIRAVPFEVAGSPRPPCLIVVVGRTEAPVGVRQVNSSYTFPLRVGLDRASRSSDPARLSHKRSQDSSETNEKSVPFMWALAADISWRETARPGNWPGLPDC